MSRLWQSPKLTAGCPCLSPAEARAEKPRILAVPSEPCRQPRQPLRKTHGNRRASFINTSGINAAVQQQLGAYECRGRMGRGRPRSAHRQAPSQVRALPARVLGCRSPCGRDRRKGCFLQWDPSKKTFSAEAGRLLVTNSIVAPARAPRRLPLVLDFSGFEAGSEPATRWWAQVGTGGLRASR